MQQKLWVDDIIESMLSGKKFSRVILSFQELGKFQVGQTLVTIITGSYLHPV